MIDRYWSYWRVNGFPFSEDQVVETLGDILAAFIAARVDVHGHVHVHSGSRFSRYARRASAESGQSQLPATPAPTGSRP